MNTLEIDHALSRGITRQYYRGAFPEDVDFHFKPPYCVVTNCDSHNGPGSHWNGWFITQSKIFFIDTYGRSPKDSTLPTAYRLFVKNKQFVFNPRIIEGLFSNTCGQFCVYFLHRLCKGDEWTDIIDSFNDNLAVNDRIVRRFVQRL